MRAITNPAGPELTAAIGRWVERIEAELGPVAAERFSAMMLDTWSTTMTPGERGVFVITGDIPLASWVIDAGGEALNPRGEIYTRETIQARLGMRNFMEELRSAGVQTGGPAPFNAADKQRFANALDKWLLKGKL